MKRLYFCRHGESELNVQMIFAGQTDTPLTDHGRDQARLAAQQAKTLQLDLVVASPLVRALETAQIIARAIDYPEGQIVVNDAFKEISWGTLEGQSFDTVPDPAVFTDMETDESLLARAQTALDFLRSRPEENILVVGHGTFANAFCSLLHFDTGVPELPNAEIVQLT